MVNNVEKYENFLCSEEDGALDFDEYLENMILFGTYGSHIELTALCEILNIKIIIHESEKHPFLLQSSEIEIENCQIIQLGYIASTKHYNRKRKLEDSKEDLSSQFSSQQLKK